MMNGMCAVSVATNQHIGQVAYAKAMTDSTFELA
jgi:hypothetical protein